MCKVAKYGRGLRVIESKSIFKLRKYKLYYLFKYSKSVAESNNIELYIKLCICI